MPIKKTMMEESPTSVFFATTLFNLRNCGGDWDSSKLLMMRLPAFLLSLLAAVIVLAQNSMPPYQPALLAIPEVAQELKLTPAQKSSLEKLRKKARANLLALVGTMQQGPKKGTTLAQIQKQINVGSQSQVNVLSSAQKARLKQLTVQYGGAFVLTTPEVVRLLKISPDQRRQLEDAGFKAMRQVQSGAPKGGHSGYKNLPVQGAAARLLQARVSAIEAYNKVAMGILSPEQRFQWTALRGKSFPLQYLYKPVAP